MGWRASYEQFDPPMGGEMKAENLNSPESIPEHERPPLRHIDMYIRPECPCLTKRMTVALFSCIGFIIMFGMRTSMGVVKVKLETDNSLHKLDNETSATVESAVFWGYFVTQIPGGLIAAAYPANRLFGAAIGTSSLLNLLIPLVFETPQALILVKVMQGLVEGVTYPSCHGIMRYWAPPLERSKLATLAFSGCYAGVMLGMPISGELIARLGDFAPFYFYGLAGTIWYLSWLWLVFEKPAYHPTIEAKELLYIENSLGNISYVPPNISNTPWKSFFTSMPCYAIFVANFCRSWNFYLLVIFQESYFKDVYGTDIETNSWMGSVPHLLMTIIVPCGGILADKIRKRGILSTTQVRKLFNCGGFGMEATFFIVMAYSRSQSEALTALALGVAFSGFAISGFNVNHLDIAPRYASVLMGISNGIGTIAGSICPYVVRYIIGEKSTKEEWRKVLILSASIHYAGIIFYGLFASGELQEWADPSLAEEKQWSQMNETVQIKKSPSGQSNGLLQRKLSGKINYGLKYGTIDTPLPPARPPRPSLPSQSSEDIVEKPAIPSSTLPPQTGGPFVPSGNPFLTGDGNRNPFRQETVQPEAQDTYMHGTISDRTY